MIGRVATVLVTADAYVHLRSFQLCPPLVVAAGGVTELVPWTQLGLVPYSAIPYECMLQAGTNMPNHSPVPCPRTSTSTGSGDETSSVPVHGSLPRSQIAEQVMQRSSKGLMNRQANLHCTVPYECIYLHALKRCTSNVCALPPSWYFCALRVWQLLPLGPEH